MPINDIRLICVFDYLANLRKLKKKCEEWAGVMQRGVLINEKSNQGVRERKRVGIHWSRNCGSPDV
jgi:hypothetical protein